MKNGKNGTDKGDARNHGLMPNLRVGLPQKIRSLEFIHNLWVLVFCAG